jgi:uncharacterized protein
MTVAIERHGEWMPTFTGGRFWPLDPRPEEVKIEDIAHHLALICRFGGTCREPYSVAQHSVLVSRIVPTEHALWGLLHDAAEAYLGDLPRPVKRLPELYCYRSAEEEIMRVICRRFGLSPEMPAAVKIADEVLLATEARDITSNRQDIRTWRLPEEPLPDTVVPWHWREAEERFLNTFHSLWAVT